MKLTMKRLATHVFCLLLWPLAALADNRPVRDLDQLYQASRPVTAGVSLLPAPLVFQAQAHIVMLPKPGKTTYIKDAFAQMGIKPVPRVSHKMWLKSPKNVELMAYVEDAVAQRMQAQLKPGDAITVQATQYWKYHRGPGLLVTGFSRTGQIEAARP